MDNKELLTAISDFMDQKIDSLRNDLEKKIENSEKNSKRELVKSENLILKEVDDVHRLLIEHDKDHTKHIA